MAFVRHTWSGLPTFLKEGIKDVAYTGINPNFEVEELIISQLSVNAGYALNDPADPRYQRASAHRVRFGEIVHRAARTLTQDHQGEDHIDAVISVAKAIEVYLTDYGLSNSEYSALQKGYRSAGE